MENDATVQPKHSRDLISTLCTTETYTETYLCCFVYVYLPIFRKQAKLFSVIFTDIQNCLPFNDLVAFIKCGNKSGKMSTYSQIWKHIDVNHWKML